SRRRHTRWPRDWSSDVCSSDLSSAVFGTDIADYWFPVSIGGDIPFLYGVLRILMERGWADQNFINKHTTGFSALASQALNLKFEIGRASCRERVEIAVVVGELH